MKKLKNNIFCCKYLVVRMHDEYFFIHKRLLGLLDREVELDA